MNPILSVGLVTLKYFIEVDFEIWKFYINNKTSNKIKKKHYCPTDSYLQGINNIKLAKKIHKISK